MYLPGMRRLLLLAAILLGSLGPAANADAPLTVIDLHHRPAEQLLPTLKPLVRQGDYLAGQNDKLFIRSDAATLEAVKRVVTQLDRTPASLLITVKQGGNSDEDANRLDGKIVVAESHSDVTLGEFIDHSSSQLGAHHQGVAGAVSADSHRTRARDTSEQQVSVAEGYEAHFYISHQRPQVSYQQGYHGQLNPALTYRSAMTGFSVIARVNGNQATLYIRPQKENFSGGDTISGQQMDTTLVAKLGEWTPVGGFNNNVSGSTRGLLARTNHRDNRRQSISIKVEKIDPSH